MAVWLYNGDMNKIKEGDVFDFRYKPDVIKDIEGRWYNGYTSHCFDGQLIAREQDGGIILKDTYWNSNDGKSFTISEAKKLGVLTFKFNLEDVENAGNDVNKYYDEKDYFNFSTQHYCYERWVVKKGAKKSKEKMMQEVNNQIIKEHDKLKNCGRES